ncbi:ATP-binding protein [Nocardia tenerifensis]|uniref:ATP-binding protein n=2 Tax=Nocardia tenerifensis TaxID=228006 RepID=UPI0014742E18|nr:LuxR C-terminal-related transcriptional regulator [Nocardia tenerifensis]
MGDDVRPTLAGTYRLPTLVGREAELAEVGRLLVDPRVRLLTLTGTAGVGKSRIAREVLSDTAFRQEITVTADLAECADRTDAWNTVLERASRRPLDAAPERLPAVEALARLAEAIGARRAILLLDNCDRVVRGISTDVPRLLEHCPNLVIVATSRVPFHLYRECVLCVRPLRTGGDTGDYYPGSAPAAQLLLDSIDSHYRGAAAVADRLVLDEIARELDGVPLAIELAAGSIARIGPVRTLRRLEAGADLRSSSYVDVPARHRTLHGAVEWGLDDVAPEVLELLLRLSLYESLIDTDIACLAAGTTEEDAATAMADLVQRSMLDHVSSGPHGHGYRLFATVRAYCRRVLAADPARARTLRDEHVDRLCLFAERMGPRFDQREHRAAALDATGKQIVDFLSAVHYLIDTGRPERAVRLAAALESAWIQFGYQSELESVLAKVLKMSDRSTLSPGVTAPLCLEVLGIWAGRSGRLRRAVDLLTSSADAYRRFDRHVDAARVAVVLVAVLVAVGERTAAAEQFAIATKYADELSGPWPGRLQVSRMLLRIPNPPTRDGEVLAKLRDRARWLDSTARLIGRNILAYTQIGPSTADRAQALYRENLADADLETQVLPVIIALEGCAAAYDAAGVEFAEPTLTLLLAARQLRAAHGIPQLGVDDRVPREAEHRSAIGENKFRQIMRRAGEMTLAEAVAYASAGPTLPNPDESPLSALTNRQREIALLVATGMTNRMIATQLGISEWTVVNHVRQVMLKLGCPSRLHVALLVERDAQPTADGSVRTEPALDEPTAELPRITVVRKARTGSPMVRVESCTARADHARLEPDHAAPEPDQGP